MWLLSKLYAALPADWFIFQNMMFADAKTFLTYNANMRQLMVDKLTSCEMVVFNRITPETDKMALHKLVRGVSRRAGICYEDLAGEIEFDQIEDPLPFDINAPRSRQGRRKSHRCTSSPALRFRCHTLFCR